jgi:hypothetical protein
MAAFFMKIFSVVFFSFFVFAVAAQSNRINEQNTIGWLANFASIKLNNKNAIHAELQVRRVKLVAEPQQLLARMGWQYQPNKNVIFRAGYALAETNAYGDIPLNVFGKKFTEHRAFEMLQINSTINSTDWQQRFMLEQRWVGKFASAADTKEAEYIFTNRIRYLLRIQRPINKKQMDNNTWYAGGFNEIFISFGKKVGENIFDQNRLALFAGYKFNKHYRLELGLLNQTVQLGREVAGKNVFQYNTGILLGQYFSF